MTFREQLKWNVPRSPWEHHEQRTLDRYGTKRLYVGIEAERIARLWLTFEETDATPRAGHTGAALKKSKRTSETPLAEQEKIEVHRDFHWETKERLGVHAKRYDVNQGVLLGYILREYYETDGWGYGIEAIESDRRGVPDEDEEPEIPYYESDKIEWIAQRVEPDANGRIHGENIRELIEEVGAASRTAFYRSAVLDRLGYVHHPEDYGLYISPEKRWGEFGIGEDDPAIERKPYEALTRDEKIEGIKTVLQRKGGVLSANEIHGQLFDGNGSVTHMRNLAQDVANAPGFTYRSTSGGTKVLRAIGPGAKANDAGAETTQTSLTETNGDAGDDHDRDPEDDQDQDQDSSSNLQLSTINQRPIDELRRKDRVTKIQIAATRQMLRKDREVTQLGVEDIQKALEHDGDGEIDEETTAALMKTAAVGSGFSIEEGEHGRTLSVDRGEVETAIEIMAEQHLEEDEDEDAGEEGKEGLSEEAQAEQEAKEEMATQQAGQAVKPGEDDIDAGMRSNATTDGGIDQGRDVA